jgi:hypothetical protein
MEIFEFNYAHKLKNYSPMIYKWAVDNNLSLFDFDNCMYTSNRLAVLEQHFVAVASKYSQVLIIEQHPFFDEEWNPFYESDDQYIETKTQIIEISNRLNLRLYFLTADYRYWDNSLNSRCFYPHWYFELRSHAKQFNYQNFNWPIDRKYNFSCNNMSNYRSEKIFNIIECVRRSRSDWILSLYDHPHEQASLIDLTNLGIVRHDQIEIWNKQIKNKIKMYEYDLINNEPLSAMSTIFKGHTESYCNLVIEHSMKIEILSEKSFKPFIAKQIPIYLAQAGACEMLTKLGFDLFYDFINHNEYDAIGKGFVNSCPEPWIKRTSKLHALIDNLYTTKFCDFFTEANTKHRLEKNNEHFYSNTIDKMCIAKFNQLLNK